VRPRIIGIAGGTASGKTTAARIAAGQLGDDALLLFHDRYYRDIPAGASPRGHNFDHPDALDTASLVADLDALRAGRPADLPVYEFSRHARAAERERVAPRPIVLVEGILVLAEPEIRARLDHAVFVDAPADIRLIRRIRRDVSERGRSVESVLSQYEGTVRPMHQAFVEPSRRFAATVLDGTQSPDVLAVALVQLARG
jgi:uridine kinase